MSEWFKQNIIMSIISSLMLIIMSMIGFNVRAVVKEMAEKATKLELEQHHLVIQKEIELNNQLIMQNAEEITQVREYSEVEIEHFREEFYKTTDLVLYEIRELRKDLKLKVDKP